MTTTPTILIADDDEGHAILIRENLEATGLSNPIRHLRNGQEVLDFFFREPASAAGPFLVLLDIRMPKVDGIEVLRRLKADATLRKLPIIMLTTTDDAREVTRCHELGCNVYLQKPVDYDRFSDAIRRLGQFVPLLHVPRLPPG